MSAQLRERISHSALRPVKIILILFLFVLTLTCSPSTVPDALCDQQVLLSLTSAGNSHWLQAFLRNVIESYNMYLRTLGLRDCD